MCDGINLVGTIKRRGYTNRNRKWKNRTEGDGVKQHGSKIDDAEDGKVGGMG